MAWIELHDTLREHRKTYDLADRLRIPNAYVVGLLGCLWTWAANSALDGDLTSFPIRAIANAAGWEKKPETLVDALIDSGWLEREGDALYIHDWDDYAGRLRETRERNRENARDRKRRQRDKERGTATKKRDSHADVTRDKRDCHASTVPNLTVPYQSYAAVGGERAREDDSGGGESDREERAAISAIGAKQVTEAMRKYGWRLEDICDGDRESVDELLSEYPADWIEIAIGRGCKKGHRRDWGYVRGILRNFRELGGPDDIDAGRSPPGNSPGLLT